jgi:stage V sporulation protein AE
MKRKVIIVTDGDKTAQQAVEAATRSIGGRCISASAGNPTELSGSEIFENIMRSPHDPVIVMFDDNGKKDKGYGERAILSLSSYPQIEIIGAVAVASEFNTSNKVPVNFSITRDGKKVNSGVDKNGFPIQEQEVHGDTVGALAELNIPTIVGLGDPGKMDGLDDPYHGAPITTMALKEIMDIYL